MSAAIETPERLCLGCGEVLTRASMYCSPRCKARLYYRRKRAARTKPMSIVCEHCHETFVVDLAGVQGAVPKTCSPECRKARAKALKLDRNRVRRAYRRRAAQPSQPRRFLHDGDCSRPCEECTLSVDGVCVDYIVATYRPLTLSEVGDLFGVCRERIRQIEVAALKKLRAHPGALEELFGEEPDWQTRPRHMERWAASELPFASTPNSGAWVRHKGSAA